MEIRKTENDDLKGVVNIAKALPEWFTPKAVRSIRRASRVQDGFVAVYKNKILGFIIYRKWKRTATITWMGVIPAYRRKGIGKKLIRKLENDIKGKGIDKIKVSTLAHTVKYEPYEETRNFYKSMGFKAFRIDKSFYKNGKIKCDRLVLLKRI